MTRPTAYDSSRARELTTWYNEMVDRPTRREALAEMFAAGAVFAAIPALLPGRYRAEKRLMIACIIRYQIDPYQVEEFARYAKAWADSIPRCGGHLIAYLLPHEGTNDVAWGIIGFEDLAAYERYRASLREDPAGKANFEFAKSRRFILREERNFVRVVDGTFNVPAQRTGAAAPT